MGFIRVRSASGPAHEYDISEAAYARNKGAYKVIDKTPVATARLATYAVVKPVETSAASVAKPAAKVAKEGADNGA